MEPGHVVNARGVEPGHVVNVRGVEPGHVVNVRGGRLRAGHPRCLNWVLDDFDLTMALAIHNSYMIHISNDVDDEWMGAEIE